jgi:signal transduction histidine kinase
MPSNPKLVWKFAPTSRSLRRVVGLTLVYFVVCKLGLKVAILHPSATAVWPGTGIALAAILLLGYEVWPGILLGAFAVNLTTAGSVASSLGIAAGNTLEAMMGAYLVNRLANGRNVFNRAEGIFKFFLFACVVATTVSATIGTASLVLTGFGRGVSWESLWVTWWLGNMAGAILVTPCLVLWSTPPLVTRSRQQVPLQIAALISLLLVGALVFGGFLSPAWQGYPLKFICIPFVVWVAFELHPREAALAVLAFSIVAIASVFQGVRDVSTPNESLLVIQVFLSIAAMTGLLVSLTVEERNRNEATLQQAKHQLEERVRERTRELEDRIVREENAERALRDLSVRLLRAQDEERRRIARELHDSTGQSLAALAMILSEIGMKVGSDPALSRQIDESEKITRTVSDELRTTSYLLHPPLLDEVGLKAGLRWYIEGFKARSKIGVILNIPESLERLPTDLELMIFRVVQECLTNVHRHSESPSVEISLCNSNEKLTLEIRDHGKGIPADRLVALTGSGLVGVGLRGMRERVKAFGGELEISSDTRGTTVRATIPLRPSLPAADT